jgi:hypothetical protein
MRTISNEPFALEILQQHYRFPLEQAAHNLGVCTTALKKMCRQHGIERWPFRKVSVIQLGSSSNITVDSLSHPFIITSSYEVWKFTSKKKRISSNENHTTEKSISKRLQLSKLNNSCFFRLPSLIKV